MKLQTPSRPACSLASPRPSLVRADTNLCVRMFACPTDRVSSFSKPHAKASSRTTIRVGLQCSVTATIGGNFYDARSPLPYGAPLNEADDVVLVRPRERVPI